MLLGRRQEAKGLADTLSAAQKKRVLQALALALMENRMRTFALSKGAELISERLSRVASPEADGKQFLKQIEDLSGLLVEREAGEYELAHKSFQEYLAAVEIREEKREALLPERLTDDWWEETIRLYAVQASDASALVRAVLDNPTVSGLTLAYECVEEEGAEVLPEVRQALHEKVEAGLESDDRATTALAAQVRLARRLRRLVATDEEPAVDPEFVTCAEYQLFIDARRAQGENRQPDHWTGTRFSPGMARQPILGVRADDAVEFCRWLSGPEPGFRYRLPTPQEAQAVPPTARDVCCWCEVGEQKLLMGVQPLKPEEWRQIYGDAFDGDMESAIRCFNLAPTDLVRGLDLSLADVLARDPVLDLDLARALYSNLVRDLPRALAPVLDHAIARNQGYKPASNEIDPRTALRLLCFLYSWYAADVHAAKRNKVRRWWIGRFLIKRHPVMDSREFAAVLAKRQALFRLYHFFILVDERRKGRLPAWEGIRIVKEKSEENLLSGSASISIGGLTVEASGG